MKFNKWTLGLAAIAATALTLMTGCALTTEKTTIVTPGLYTISKDAAGNLQTNQVSPGSTLTTIKKDRLQLPAGYILMAEDDMFGAKVEMTSASSTLPNVIVGEHHGSFRLIPTSTNIMYAAAMTVNGSIDNKAIPFWISSKGALTAGPSFVAQTTDTNGTSATSGASVPGTPTPQQTK